MRPERQSSGPLLTAGETVRRKQTDTNEGRRPVSGCLCSTLMVSCEQEMLDGDSVFVLSCLVCYSTWVRI